MYQATSHRTQQVRRREIGPSRIVARAGDKCRYWTGLDSLVYSMSESAVYP